jgi:cytochrome c553
MEGEGMKPFIGIVSLLVLGICLGVMLPAHADHHNKRIVVNSVVAVPVAVPVATFSPVKYSNQVVPYTDPPKSPEELLLDRLATLVAAKLEGKAVQAQAVKPTMFATKCAACHAKNKIDGYLSLDDLDSEKRLIAVRAIVTEKMPKGQKLTPAEVGQLMLELSTVPEVKAAVQSDVPPSPQPPEEKP